MLIKVCGLTIPEQINQLDQINEVGFLGFIFYEKSKRFISEVSTKTNASKRVGVFVNDSEETILKKVKDNQLDVVQLHGDECPLLCGNLRKSVQIIKAFGVDEVFDFSLLEAYQNSVDYFLFDTKSSSYGGTGIQYDWSILENYKGNIPFFLSGGLNEESTDRIKQFKHPQCVGIDLNSGFEIEPGVKSIDKIENFVNVFKQLEYGN
jgi:phosphoribosylanthranilate isomerase